MTRERRFTVRLADREMKSIRQFAEQNHVLPSVALRRLVEAGLIFEDRARQQGFQQTRLSTHEVGSPEESSN